MTIMSDNLGTSPRAVWEGSIRFDGPHPAWCERGECEGEWFLDSIHHRSATHDVTLTAEPLRPLREVEGQPRVVIPSELEVFAEQRPGHAPEITVYVGTESIEGEFALTTPEARRMAAHLVALADALEQDVEVAAAE